jgi:hypothetical protein
MYVFMLIGAINLSLKKIIVTGDGCLEILITFVLSISLYNLTVNFARLQQQPRICRRLSIKFPTSKFIQQLSACYTPSDSLANLKDPLQRSRKPLPPPPPVISISSSAWFKLPSAVLTDNDMYCWLSGASVIHKFSRVKVNSRGFVC